MTVKNDIIFDSENWKKTCRLNFVTFSGLENSLSKLRKVRNECNKIELGLSYSIQYESYKRLPEFCFSDSMTQMSASDSSSVNGSDLSSGEFDSDAESRVSSLLTESLAEEETGPIVESERKEPGEVDLSAFNDLCRKILAKKVPDGYKTGELLKLPPKI